MWSWALYGSQVVLIEKLVLAFTVCDRSLMQPKCLRCAGSSPVPALRVCIAQSLTALWDPPIPYHPLL